MSGDTAMPSGPEKIPFRTGLANLSRLLEDFSSSLRVWRDELGGDYEERWRALHGDPKSSLSRTLDRLLLPVYERHLEVIRGLRSAILEEVYEVREDDPFGLPEPAIRFRKKADLKVLYLEDQVKRVMTRLGLRLTDPDEEAFALPGNAESALSKEAGDDERPIVPAQPTQIRRDNEAKLKPRGDEVSPAALQAKVDSLRRVFRHERDLKIRSRSGEETMSLQYFLLASRGGEPVAMLDLEHFVNCQRIALGTAIRMLQGLDAGLPRVGAILKRVQDFIKALYRSVRSEIAGTSQRIIPYTGHRIDRNVLYNFETMVNMREWRMAEDIEEFRELFYARLEWPLTELLGKPEERRKYLESIVEAAEHYSGKYTTGVA